MTENVASENWQHYSTSTVKRKRADLVCTACHAKKVKCDLQQQRNRGRDACKNCHTGGRECHVRASKRERRRKLHTNVSDRHPEKGLNFSHISSGVDALLNADAALQAFSGDPSPHDDTAYTNPEPDQSRISSMRDSCTAHFGIDASPQSMFTAPIATNRSPLFQRETVGTSLTATTPTQNGDVDTGFLQVYAQENQFDAENQALVARLEHQYSSVLSQDLEQIFTDTYFEYCYTWCPVLDRSTLASDLAQSPLLANALALASSHIQPPLLPHDGPETYYKRARNIFYDDEEADETMALKALCLFYWWAPQSPSRVHRHS